MAIPYTQDWAAGNSTFTSMDVYDRPTDGPDALYPEVRHQTDCTVSGGALDWNTTDADYSAAGIWFQTLGSLTGGGAGAYALTGFWDASVGFVECTYTPNATSLGVASYSPLITLVNPGGFSVLDLSYDHAVPEYVIQRNTDAGFASNSFAGETPTAGVPLTVRLAWQCGTYNAGPDDHDADGYLRVYLNETLAYDETAISLYLTYLTTPRDLIDGVAFGFVGLIGALDDIAINDTAFVPSLALTGCFAIGAQASVAGVTRAGCIALDGSAHSNTVEGTLLLGGDLNLVGMLELTDGMTAPAVQASRGQVYVDSADGDLKIIFGDGTIKTIVTDT